MPPSLPPSSLPPRSTSTSRTSSAPPPTTVADTTELTRHRWLRLLAAAVARLYAKPRTESSLKYAGGFVAALAAMRYARSLASAGLIGLFAGIVAHSLYADVLKKAARPSMALLPDATSRSLELASPPRSRARGGVESDDECDEGNAEGADHLLL